MLQISHFLSHSLLVDLIGTGLNRFLIAVAFGLRCLNISIPFPSMLAGLLVKILILEIAFFGDGKHSFAESCFCLDVLLYSVR